MEIIAKDKRHSPDAKQTRLIVLFSLWAGGFLTLAITSFDNWGVLAVAALFTVLTLITHKEPYRIHLDRHGLSIRQGETFLWSAAYGELQSVEVAEASKRLGITLAPKSVIFHKCDGDLYAMAYDVFNEADIIALLHELEHRT